MLEEKAPADHRELRPMLFTMHVSWLWRLVENLHSLYTISRQLGQKRVARPISLCLDHLEKIAAKLWPE